MKASLQVERSYITLVNRQPVYSLAISPDGRTLAVGQQDDGNRTAYLSLWDIADHALQFEVENELMGMVQCVRFSPDGDGLAYAMNDSTVRFYEMTNRRQFAKRLIIPELHWISYATSRDRLAASGRTVEVWDAHDQKTIWRLQIPQASVRSLDSVLTATLDPAGQLVAVAGTGEGTVILYDLEKKSESRQLEDAPERVRWLAFDSEGQHLAAIEWYSQGVFLWDLGSENRYLPEVFNAKADQYLSLAFQPGGEYLALGMVSGYLAICRLSDGQNVFFQQGHDGRIWDLAFTPDGSTVISGGEDGVICFWRIELFLPWRRS